MDQLLLIARLDHMGLQLLVYNVHNENTRLLLKL